MLNLPPLYQQIKREAIATAFRMLVNNQAKFKPGDLVGHLKIFEDFSHIMDQSIVSDKMMKTFNLVKPFKVIIPDRVEWQERSPITDEGAIIYYTDGSKLEDNSTGIGVYGAEFKYHEALGKSPTIFQAEVYAIEVCAKEIMKRIGYRNQNVYIAIDSQAALKALNSYVLDSKLVAECLKTLTLLGLRSKLTLMWVPGHEGIVGNEAADELAKKGAETMFIGPEPVLGYGLNHQKNEINIWEERVKRDHFNSLPLDSKSRLTIEYNKKRSKEILSLRKSELRLLTGILTGHCGLKSHLFKIGKSRTNLCRLCRQKAETAIHLMCDCESADKMRQKYFGKGLILPPELKSLTPKSIVGFFRELNLENL